MIERLIIAGSGGQGIMLLGKVLAEAAMSEGRFVTWLPAYGAEVRGGTAYCMVVISDQEIGSPFIDVADTLLIMNEPSWEKFRTRVIKGGLYLINSSLVNKDLGVIRHFFQYPFSDLAVKLGNIKVANMVALGSYLAKRKIVGDETVKKIIAEIAPQDKQDLIRINQEALLEGIKIAK